MDGLIDALMDVVVVSYSTYLQRVQIREPEYYYRRDGRRTVTLHCHLY
jgi:hypothetical protein